MVEPLAAPPGPEPTGMKAFRQLAPAERLQLIRHPISLRLRGGVRTTLLRGGFALAAASFLQAAMTLPGVPPGGWQVAASIIAGLGTLYAFLSLMQAWRARRGQPSTGKMDAPMLALLALIILNVVSGRLLRDEPATLGQWHAQSVAFAVRFLLIGGFLAWMGWPFAGRAGRALVGASVALGLAGCAVRYALGDGLFAGTVTESTFNIVPSLIVAALCAQGALGLLLAGRAKALPTVAEPTLSELRAALAGPAPPTEGPAAPPPA